VTGEGVTGDGLRLDQAAVAVVLHRAAALADGVGSAAGAPDPAHGVSVAALEEAAAEVGIEPWAVRQAVAEWQAGLLDVTPTRDRPSVVTAGRVVPLPPEAVEAELTRFCRAQVLTLVRHRAGGQRWRRRHDPLASLRRLFDLRGRHCLAPVAELVVTVVPCAEGSAVRLQAELRPPLRVRTGRVAALAAAAGLGTAVVAVTTGIPDAVALAALPGGGAAAGGAVLVARASRQRDIRLVLEALERELDRLERADALPPPRVVRLGQELDRRLRALRP